MSRIHMTFVIAFTVAVFATAGEGMDRKIDYGDEIAPLLARHCLECHGPDAEQRQAGLRFDFRRAAIAKLETGTFAVVPGDASASELVKRITSTGDDRMPPADETHSLSAQEINLLIRWIEQGAIWRSHWAFTPPIKPRLPKVDDNDWVRNPIDRFILARLEHDSRQPFAHAAPRKLVRRVYFDLIGLPPTPQEVAEFLNDRRPDAWQRLIDRLLMSPQYGQRWDAIGWMLPGTVIPMAEMRTMPTRWLGDTVIMSSAVSMMTCRTMHLCTNNWQVTCSIRL